MTQEDWAWRLKGGGEAEGGGEFKYGAGRVAHKWRRHRFSDQWAMHARHTQEAAVEHILWCIILLPSADQASSFSCLQQTRQAHFLAFSRPGKLDGMVLNPALLHFQFC
jgi:hypothetical protein